MKISQQEKVFPAITITLESEDEALAMLSIANYTPVSEFLDDCGVCTDTLRETLMRAAPDYRARHRQLVVTVERFVRKNGEAT